jgi:nucleotide-binding universal stress UspA family protein
MSNFIDSKSLGNQKYKKILVPIDSNRPAVSKKIANHAVQIALLQTQRSVSTTDFPIIVILNVIDDIKQGGVIGLQAKYGNIRLLDSFDKVREGVAKRLMLEMLEDVDSKEVKLNIQSKIIHSRGRSLAKAIVDYIEDNDIDLVVIGAGDLFKLKYLLVGGSVTGKVIKNCKCPILLIH